MDNQELVTPIDKEFKYEINTDTPDELLEDIAFPSNLESNTEKLIQSLDSLKDEDKKALQQNPALLNWFTALYRGSGLATQSDVYNKKINNVNNEFEQEVIHNTDKLKAGHLSFKTKQGASYTGENKKIRFMQSLNLGTPFQIPLYHSGFWVAIKSPSESTLLELDRQIANEKTVLSRATYGVALSNSNVFLNNNILECAFEHIFNSTLDLKDNEDIRDYVKIQDMPILIWGLACAVWSKGFSYQRACTVDHVKCTHVLEAILSLRKLQFTNTKELTSKQLDQMNKRTPNSVSIESLSAYQNEFNVKSSIIKLTDEVSIRLKVPTIRQHVEAGYTWITDIENNFADALLKSEKERENYLINQSKCTISRNYAHFVDALIRKTYDDDNEILEEDNDKALIDSMLNELNIDYTNVFIDGCVKFIEDVTVSLIAIPNYKCPKCGEKQVINREEGFKSELISIDPSTVFSILLSQKVRMIQMR